MVTRETLFDIAKDLGFNGMGIIAPEHMLTLPGREARAIPFTAASVAVLSYPAFRWADREDAPDEDITQREADVSAWYVSSNASHHASVQFVKRLNELGILAERVGTARAKTSALFAGLGVYRMNTLLFTPDSGSYQALQVIALSQSFDFDEPSPCGSPEKAELALGCASCGRCQAACPTGALDGKGGIDRQKCLRSHMFSGKPTPIPYRTLMGSRLLGCDICQSICPMQPPGVPIKPRPVMPFLRVDALLAPTNETLSAFGDHVGVNYVKAHLIQAQAALIAGNLCMREFLPALESLLNHSDEAVREHAQWAAQRIRFGCP